MIFYQQKKWTILYKQLCSYLNGKQAYLLTFTSLHLIFEKSLVFYLQVDRLEDELISEQEKFKGITEELEQTFAEMSGY